ncbi:hypothetical protein [Microcoleus sp. PH2017_32_RDM_D_A]|uniref:hypothetical protein n=1 Tax=Microcoleus sp. PH2017_32_RDM_D_A TaxID=2798842 RepID=UPI001DB69576|nr:hypothetical protein [Microcoleus sp. PH2017_32_RDM_D_A]MCC3582511.1 hypothetical protein [Microcoleus sp. PH2017_32_RDM_D_A]
MSKLQDSYAAAVAHLGIERGIKFSPARHQKIRQYYTAVNSQETVLDLNLWLPEPEPEETDLGQLLCYNPVLTPSTRCLQNAKGL